jgi:hypothetical protein
VGEAKASTSFAWRPVLKGGSGNHDLPAGLLDAHERHTMVPMKPMVVGADAGQATRQFFSLASPESLSKRDLALGFRSASVELSVWAERVNAGAAWLETRMNRAAVSLQQSAARVQRLRVSSTRVRVHVLEVRAARRVHAGRETVDEYAEGGGSRAAATRRSILACVLSIEMTNACGEPPVTEILQAGLRSTRWRCSRASRDVALQSLNHQAPSDRAARCSSSGDRAPHPFGEGA